MAFVPWIYASLSNYVAYLLFPVSFKYVHAEQEFSMSGLLFSETLIINSHLFIESLAPISGLRNLYFTRGTLYWPKSVKGAFGRLISDWDTFSEPSLAPSLPTPLRASP